MLNFLYNAENILFVRMRHKYLHDPPAFYTKEIVFTNSSSIRFWYRECGIPEMFILYDTKFSTNMQRYASFFQSYERQLHECKGLNTRKEG